tara:strand:- start:587 stop:796 length:210 start_codon:yes stop_codon:yes gene_type:complete
MPEVDISDDGFRLRVICHDEEIIDRVVNKLQKPNCILSGYEEWDEGEDKKWILTFDVGDKDTDVKPELN